MKGGTLAVRQPLYLLSQKLLQDIDALWVGQSVMSRSGCKSCTHTVVFPCPPPPPPFLAFPAPSLPIGHQSCCPHQPTCSFSSWRLGVLLGWGP